jgi:uncharacterized iron-regulated protein
MDNKEESIEELCEAFDKIIGSDNEAVQRMFRHLLTLVELTDQNHDENKSLTGLGLRTKGPFGSLFDRLDQLERKVNEWTLKDSLNSYKLNSYNMSQSSSTAGTMSGIDTITLSGVTLAQMQTSSIPSLSINDISISMSDSDSDTMFINKIDKK